MQTISSNTVVVTPPSSKDEPMDTDEVLTSDSIESDDLDSSLEDLLHCVK
jgi:hypothetical protein